MARYTVEADGGSRGNPGPAGYGAVVRDRSGAVVRELAASIGTATNNVAEYRGLIAGLQAVLELDPAAEVEVRMDSKLVVEQMSGRWRVRHADMRVLAAEASALVRRLPSVRFLHVPRERNREADRLANEAMDAAAAGRVWHEEAPAGGRAVTAPAPLPVPSPWLGDRTTALVALLTRHGATELSAEARFCGVTDVALNAVGVHQARLLAEALSRTGAQAVVSSPLRRCVQTAEEIARGLRCPVTIDDDLRETDFGAWEGLTLGEVATGWGEELAAWRGSPDVAPPTGESLTATAVRVEAALARLRESFGGNRVVVVTHVTPIKLLVLHALRSGPEAVFRLHIEPASVSRVDFLDDSSGLLRSLNETAHLT